MTGSLTALGAGAVLLVKPGQSFTFALTVADEEAFIGTVRLERSRTGGQAWDAVTTWIGTEATPLEGAVASGTVVNGDSEAARYRVAVLAIDEESDGVDWTLAQAVDVDPAQTVTNRDGVPILTYTDEGIATPKITATVLLAPGHLLDFSAVPTDDPAVAGQLWLDAGVLKISAGA